MGKDLNKPAVQSYISRDYSYVIHSSLYHCGNRSVPLFIVPNGSHSAQPQSMSALINGCNSINSLTTHTYTHGCTASASGISEWQMIACTVTI